MSRIVLYLDNDNGLTLRGLHTKNPKTYVNDGTVGVTLRDSSGDALAGQSWPLAMSYVAGSDGDYVGTLEDTLVASVGDVGTVEIALAGSSLIGNIELEYVFAERVAVDYWTSRIELERMFGATSVSKWADLENLQVSSDIVERIDWACREATDDARLRLRGSSAHWTRNAPRQLRLAVTRLAGVLLYESRGIIDTSSEKGEHRLSRHEKIADLFFRRVQAGQLRLADESDETVHVPVFVEDTDEEEALEDRDPFVAS
jgi:hypothetical protein